MKFYVSLFKGEIVTVDRWGAGEQGKEGDFKRGAFSLAGREFIVFDSPVKHKFTFTPSVSIFVECEAESELDHAYAQLLEGGEALMPLDNYGFSKKFAWVNDRFGVSWQLNWA